MLIPRQQQHTLSSGMMAPNYANPAPAPHPSSTLERGALAPPSQSRRVAERTETHTRGDVNERGASLLPLLPVTWSSEYISLTQSSQGGYAQTSQVGRRH
ncbi:hypothetical protein WA026_004822 [Henosepilachna vigintioctopunctata]|uniref:Uncharacterized protein n=1 Tax=Henosepilachna vigintioctopunctata TaxID=420089 RepID=A0AAW1USR2_9CUCU